MPEQFANFASTTLATSVVAGTTSLVVSSTSLFPSTGNFRVLIDNEIFLVTGVSGTTWTVTPGAEGTTQAGHTSGAQIAHILTAAAIKNIPQNTVVADVKRDYGAVGDGVADDTTAIANAFAAVVAKPGVLYFPAGTYKTTGSLALVSGVAIVGAGSNATTINYGGTGFWIDVAANTLVQNVRIEDLQFKTTTGSSLGFLRLGRTSQTFNAALMCAQWSLRNLYCQGFSTSNVGSIGISASQYIDWTLHNVTLNNFERAAIFDRGGNSTGDRVRFQSFKFGPKWTNNIGGCQDTYISPEFLGPVTAGGGAGVGYGYTCEIDAQFVTFINALYETQPGGNSQGYLHITNANGAYFTDINGALSLGATADNSFVFDNGFVHPRFFGTGVTVSGAGAISAGTPGTGNLGARAEFIGCSGQLNALAQALPATKALIVGMLSDTNYQVGDTIVTGSGATLGFYGVTPTARQLLATGAGHSVDDVITALQTLGLVRQS